MCVFIVTVTFLPSYCLATIRGFLSSNDRGCTYRHIDCLEGCIKCAVEMGSGTVIYIVREYSDETLGNRWIGRGGPITWLPCSPDLTPLSFFLWGYESPVETRHGLVAGIAVAAGAVLQVPGIFQGSSA